MLKKFKWHCKRVLLILKLCLCMSVWVSLHVSMVAYGGQKGASDPMELKLYVVWATRYGWSSYPLQYVLWTISPAPYMTFWQLNIGNNVQVLCFPCWVLDSIILGYGVWFCEFELLRFADSTWVYRNRTHLADGTRTGMDQVWRDTDHLLLATVCWFNMLVHSLTLEAEPVKKKYKHLQKDGSVCATKRSLVCREVWF